MNGLEKYFVHSLNIRVFFCLQQKNLYWTICKKINRNYENEAKVHKSACNACMHVCMHCNTITSKFQNFSLE
uniref:Uncharacterized protein n=1 Tax=Onchocerca volvulus TaxID=6282 RepID=A0A8R1Y3F7_ONCVO